MSEKNEKEILETLSGLTGAIGSRFDKVDDRFNKIDEKLVEHDQKFGQIDQQFGEIRQQLGDMSGQLDRIEHNILEEHTRRIEALERKVGLTA